MMTLIPFGFLILGDSGYKILPWLMVPFMAKVATRTTPAEELTAKERRYI